MSDREWHVFAALLTATAIASALFAAWIHRTEDE